jgi:YVTN family beta-propeller protein
MSEVSRISRQWLKIAASLGVVVLMTLTVPALSTFGLSLSSTTDVQVAETTAPVVAPASTGAPATSSVAPYVAYTLDLCNNSLIPGNYLATGCDSLAPVGIAYDSRTNEDFVLNEGAGYASVINDRTNSVVTTISLGSHPMGAVYDSAKGEVFATNYGSATVSVISDSTNSVVATIPVGYEPHGITYDSGVGEIFVDDFGSTTVSVISDSTNSVVATIPVGANPINSAYDSSMGEVFVDNFNSGNVTVIDDSTNSAVANIDTGLNPQGIEYDSGMGEVFVANSVCNPVHCYNYGNVSVISDQTDDVVATIAAEQDPGFVAYDTVSGEVFVANYGSESVTVISDSSNSVVSTVAVGYHPYSIAFDAGNGYVYVSNEGQGTESLVYVTPSLDSVSLSPIAVSLAPTGIQAFTASPTCSTICPSGVTYSWSLTDPAMGILSSTSGNPVSFTAGSTAGTVGLFVNASFNGFSVQSSSIITIISSPPPTLDSVTVSPASDTIGTGGTSSPFTATPTCSATCPAGITYSWTLTDSSMGSLSSPSGNPVTFTAASTAGTLALFVNASLNGNTAQGSAAITITSPPPPTLTSVAVAPASGTVTVGGTTPAFTAIPACSASCPYGIAYSWTLTNSAMGSISSQSDNPITFAAGNTEGMVGLFVNASLNGITVQSSGTVITIDALPVILAGVAISPASAYISPGGTMVFAANPSCTSGGNGAACPGWITYVWSLNNTEGNLSAMSGSSVTFAAGNSAGEVNLTVTATLNSVEASSAAQITIVEMSIIKVTLSQITAALGEGGSQTFTATPACSGGTCPAVVTYRWALSNPSMGTLSSSKGSQVKFTAGNTAGGVTLFVNVSMYGKVVGSSAKITVSSTQSAASPVETWLILLLVVVVVGVVLAATMIRRRKQTLRRIVTEHEEGSSSLKGPVAPIVPRAPQARGEDLETDPLRGMF